MSDPDDPATLRVSETLASVLASRRQAVTGFFSPSALAAQEVRHHLDVDACVATLHSMGVRVPQSGEVKAYLLAHADLLGALREIAGRTMARCAPRDEVSLELYRDPEAHDEYLTMYLRQRQYAADAWQLIEELGEATGALLAGSSGWVLVTTDFQPPREG